MSSNNKTITNYFSQTKKTSIEPQRERGIKASENFYKNCLGECKNVECENEKENLKKQISESKKKKSRKSKMQLSLVVRF